ILQLVHNGVGPAAIINERCEPIVATGVIMANVPCVDRVDVNIFKDHAHAIIENDTITLINKKEGER
ncbi:MAG: aconitase X swivel domain-containing protein, partial [Candidatus Helarchaeales archaeon]